MTDVFTEKRVYGRVPLDTPFFAVLRTEDGAEFSVQLIDCGRGGVQLAFSPAETRTLDIVNNGVLLLGLPLPAQEKGHLGVAGFVAWVGAGRCGVRFDRPLSLTDDEIKQVTERL